MSYPVLTLMSTQAGFVVSKALLRATNELGISNARLAQIIGVSAASITRVGQGKLELAEGTKAFELATLIIRLYAALMELVGTQSEAQKWLSGHNLAFDARPVDLITKTEGLVAVVGYLESTNTR